MKSLKIVGLFLAAVFLGVNTALAHQSDGHQLTDQANPDGKNLEAFVKHAAAHLCEAESFGEVLRLLDDFRNEGGHWKAGSTHLVLLSERGGVFVHADNRELEDQVWSNLEDANGKNVGQEFLNAGVFDPLRCVGEEGYMGEGQEVSYGSNGKAYVLPLVARSVPFIDPNGIAKFILLGGFDYTPESIPEPQTFAELVESLAEEVSKPVSVIRDIVTPGIDAMAVGDREDLDSDKGKLRRFVKNAFTLLSNSFAEPQALDPVALRRVFRYEGGPWRSGSTYIYIMDDRGNVIFNGANRAIEQTNLWNHPEVGDAIQRLIAASKEADGGFVEYNWDDPSVPDDDPPEGGPGGLSPKLGYTKAFTFDKGDLKREPRFYVFGSGLYLGQEEEEGSDGGCAIAGVENKAQNGIYITALFLGLALFISNYRGGK